MQRKACFRKFGGVLALIVTASIWGLAFSAQRQGMQFLSANMFLAIRSWIGFFVLIPVVLVMDSVSVHRISFWGIRNSGNEKAMLIRGGALCGLILFLSSLLQQVGLVYATAGKGGFLTALYIVIVPVLGIFLKRKTTWLLWIAVGIVLTGTYLLCGSGGIGGFGKGDWFLLSCAFCYALHIMVVDHYVPYADCIRLSLIQFFITAVFATVATFLNGEIWNPELIRGAVGALLFCGIGSSGIAYTLQIVGQKYVHPVAACLIMSLESVFSVLGGWLVLGELLSVRELTGCVLILIAVILAQIPVPSGKNSGNPETAQQKKTIKTTPSICYGKRSVFQEKRTENNQNLLVSISDDAQPCRRTGN